MSENNENLERMELHNYVLESIDPARRENEPYDEYRARRKAYQSLVRNMYMGKKERIPDPYPYKSKGASIESSWGYMNTNSYNSIRLTAVRNDNKEVIKGFYYLYTRLPQCIGKIIIDGKKKYSISSQLSPGKYLISVI